jgi:DNA-binding HxlR family transcriptional regulator
MGLSESEMLFKLFSSVYCEDVKFRILEALSVREGTSLRQLARVVGIHHKNLSKYLEELSRKGVVESFEINPRMWVYRLSRECEFLREFFKQVQSQPSAPWGYRSSLKSTGGRSMDIRAQNPQP